MISVRNTLIIAIIGSFIAGSFVASPELRAYAANTIRSGDIVDGEVKNGDLAQNAVTTSKINDGAVKTVDIGDGEVKLADMASNSIDGSKIVDRSVGPADIGFNSVGSLQIFDGEVNSAEIATDAVGADEIAGVTKLLFNECSGLRNTNVSPGNPAYFECFIAGSSVGDNVIATRNSGNGCFVVDGTRVVATNIVGTTVRNVCDFDTPPGTFKYSIIVYDI